MSGTHKNSDGVKELQPESVDGLVSRIRSLAADDKISSARQLADEALREHPHSDDLKLLRQVLYPGHVQSARLPDASHRSDMEWLAQHQDEHRGKWVALLNGQLLASGVDLEDLLSALSPLGSQRRPLIHHICH